MDKNQSDVLQNCKKKRMKNESGDKSILFRKGTLIPRYIELVFRSKLCIFFFVDECLG